METPFFFYTGGHRQPPSSAVGNFNLNIHNHHHEQQPDFTNTQVPYAKEQMFQKPLTPSDVGKLNRLVIPKQHAEKYFPLLDDQQKGLLLSFEDADDHSAGKLWRFRYSYWNSSQSYVLTKGWSRYVKEKCLDAGDIVLFHRNMSDSHTMFIGCRRRSAAVLQDMSMAAQPVGTAAQVSEWSTRVFYDAPQLNYPSSPHPPLSLPLPYQHDVYLHAAAGDVENYKREVVATRRLRLFGVNLECPDDSEPSTSYGSSHGGQSDHQYI